MATQANRAQEYKLITPIGEGSFGVAWKAQHVTTGRDVVVKVLKDTACRDSKLVRRELENHSSLFHPHVSSYHGREV